MNLANMTIPELQNLSKEIDAQIKKAQDENRQHARDQIESIARAAGIPLKELISTQQKTSAKPVVAKYQNPANADQKWSGRGRQPTWVKDHLEQGGSLDGITIK